MASFAPRILRLQETPAYRPPPPRHRGHAALPGSTVPKAGGAKPNRRIRQGCPVEGRESIRERFQRASTSGQNSGLPKFSYRVRKPSFRMASCPGFRAATQSSRFGWSQAEQEAAHPVAAHDTDFQLRLDTRCDAARSASPGTPRSAAIAGAPAQPDCARLRGSRKRGSTGVDARNSTSDDRDCGPPLSADARLQQPRPVVHTRSGRRRRSGHRATPHGRGSRSCSFSRHASAGREIRGRIGPCDHAFMQERVHRRAPFPPSAALPGACTLRAALRARALSLRAHFAAAPRHSTGKCRLDVRLVAARISMPRAREGRADPGDGTRGWSATTAGRSSRACPPAPCLRCFRT